jgi:hypothetical protein
MVDGRVGDVGVLDIRPPATGGSGGIVCEIGGGVTEVVGAE